MKHGKRLTKAQKKLLRDNKLNDENYLLERDLVEGPMFVDRGRTHRLFYDRVSKVFSRLEV